MDLDEQQKTPSRKRSRPSSQPSTPSSRKHRLSDRFIPTRLPDDYDTSYALLDNRENGQTQPDTKLDAFELALRNELAGPSASAAKAASANIWLDDKLRSSSSPGNLFKYNGEEVTTPSKSRPWASPSVSMATQQLLCSPRKTPRKIPKVPFKVLDAPDLQDDFYLNLVDWSQQNVLTVGLSKSVYLWSACNSQVTNLCDLSSENDEVASVCWMGKGQHLAVGTAKGVVQIWDVQAGRRLRTMTGHMHRVGTIAAKTSVLASGSRDRKILMRDVRVKDQFVGELVGHKQEVCGLKWSCDKQYLASGGNDNKLLVWDPSNTKAGPVLRFTDHQAAVKAIAWSPHQHGLLASGGGTADRCIRFWNTTTGQALQCVDTGSQVCNLAWSKTANEIVSTHGYSQHQIVVWKYPSMASIATLTGHTYRVLYLAMSPDGETIVTGAGDETLRFWTVFQKSRAGGGSQPRSLLAPFSQIR